MVNLIELSKERRCQNIPLLPEYCAESAGQITLNLLNTAMQHSTVFATLLAQLEQHSEVSDRLSALDDLSTHLAPLKKSLRLLPEYKGAHFRLTAERYAKALEQFMFVSLVCRRKIDAINELIRYATEAQNAIALAQGARSLVEHVAVQAEIARALNQFGEQIKGQTDGIRIHDAMSKAEEFLFRCYFGKSPKIEKDKSKQALHIHDCIDTLERESPGLSDSYDFLCEFVHPNHGSNSLVSSIDLSNHVNSIVTDMSRPETQRMASIVLSAILASENLENHGHASIALLGFYAQRFVQPNSKISNIFAAHKIKPTGDGKTKETAFFFPGTRDAKEALELWAQYLENRNIKVQGRQLAAMEGNSAYDRYETTRGQLWHRIEYPIIEDGEASEEQGFLKK